jgi:hypothetical protein
MNTNMYANNSRKFLVVAIALGLAASVQSASAHSMNNGMSHGGNGGNNNKTLNLTVQTTPVVKLGPQMRNSPQQPPIYTVPLFVSEAGAGH